VKCEDAVLAVGCWKGPLILWINYNHVLKWHIRVVMKRKNQRFPLDIGKELTVGNSTRWNVSLAKTGKISIHFDSSHL